MFATRMGTTITVRLIRSFEHGNVRPVVFKNISMDLTVQEFQDFVLESIKTRQDLVPPVRNYDYDTMKIMHKAHGYKSNDRIIDTEKDYEFMLQPAKTLKNSSVENETEVSFFKQCDYIKYKEAIRISA